MNNIFPPDESLSPFEKFQLARYSNIFIRDDPKVDPNDAYDEQKERELFDFTTPENENDE